MVIDSTIITTNCSPFKKYHSKDLLIADVCRRIGENSDFVGNRYHFKDLWKVDKEINKLYSCISKPHQDRPIQIVDNCYSQDSIAGITGSGNHNININNNNIETRLITIATPLKVFW
ncbi:MAG: hypothetical protein WCF23_14630 [Candidatus Nitrosopolaris sp.]